MRLDFTKMQGAGNDFIVVDALARPLDLTGEQWARLADRRFGIGADQILIVGPPSDPAHDFSYRIINADGGEVEHCGNGARAFLRYVRERGLTDKSEVVVEIQPGVITLRMRGEHMVDVEMGVPDFSAESVGFDHQGLTARDADSIPLWTVPLGDGEAVDLTVASFGNPHAVLVVDDVDHAPVGEAGPMLEHHPRFADRVNAGFMQVLDRHAIRLRVWERGAGETLACGTGACAAAVIGIERGLLDSPVEIEARGGRLEVRWDGPGSQAVLSGPAEIVYTGSVEI
ncbi:diaminopimelate epimerase [soil metagenome]